MLDSALENLLASKQVNPSKIDVEKETDNDLKSDEAEVRLVVRFIVEEQIVYKGNIERVHQLESEELSRVVSRVAWIDSGETQEDGSEETKDNTEIPSVSPERPSTVDDQTNSTLDADEPATFTVSDKTTDNVDQFKTGLECDRDMPNERPASNDICAKSLPADSNEVTLKEQDLNLEQERITCDSELDAPSVHCCGEEQQSCCIPELDMTRSRVNIEMSELGTIHCNSVCISLTEPIVESGTDDQSVTEALNECLNNVEIESKQHEACVETDVHEVEVRDLPDLSSDPGKPLPIQHDASNIEVNSNERLAGEGEHENSRLASHRDSDHSYTHLPETIADNELRTDISKTSPTSLRRSSQAPSNTSRRIRRSASKEQRIYKNNVTNRTPGSAHASQNIAPTKVKNLSVCINNQPIRQNRVFARWSDNHFYPGTILRPTKDRKFMIGFFDGAQRNVVETDLIPLCNIEGKQVRVSIAKNYCVNAMVHDQLASSSDQPMFDVEYQQDGLVRRCVPLKDIFLTGEQGTPLISQPDKNNGASNFADVDLDNIIYEKRSRRLQDMEDYELAESASISVRKKRCYNAIRNVSTVAPKVTTTENIVRMNATLEQISQSLQNGANRNTEGTASPDVLKTCFTCPDSDSPSEGPSSTSSSNVPMVPEEGQEFYFTNSPHRAKTSLLL